MSTFILSPIGIVRSDLTDRETAPRQGHEGAPAAWIDIDPAYADGLAGLAVGADMLVVTWLHQAHRDTLRVRPRRNRDAEPTGVFATRSPDRPNPLGLHRVRLVAAEGTRLRVEPLEALDGTPVLDLKPVLGGNDG